jgi:hypothetical protein
MAIELVLNEEAPVRLDDPGLVEFMISIFVHSRVLRTRHIKLINDEEQEEEPGLLN